MSGRGYKHYAIMMRYIFRIFTVIFGFATGYAIWMDLTNSYTASAPLGQLWYSHNPRSLQYFETFISRYIDPCSLITAFDCSPFLWHPLISTILGWPAALVLSGLCALFYWLGASRSGRRKSVRNLNRRGTK